MTGDKLNVDFLVMVMKITRPKSDKKFDEQAEAKYRKDIEGCNERGKFIYVRPEFSNSWR
jgi:hypothetical protein